MVHEVAKNKPMIEFSYNYIRTFHTPTLYRPSCIIVFKQGTNFFQFNGFIYRTLILPKDSFYAQDMCKHTNESAAYCKDKGTCTYYIKCSLKMFFYSVTIRLRGLNICEWRFKIEIDSQQKYLRFFKCPHFLERWYYFVKTNVYMSSLILTFKG